MDLHDWCVSLILQVKQMQSVVRDSILFFLIIHVGNVWHCQMICTMLSLNNLHDLCIQIMPNLVMCNVRGNTRRSVKSLGDCAGLRTESNSNYCYKNPMMLIICS